MKKSILFLAICIACAACSSHKKIIKSDSTALAASAADRDGSSFEKAIIITETSERQGIDAEYAWIRKQYPGSKTAGQALTYRDKKPFDIIHIITADDKKLDVYFDISNFYGKF